MVATIPENPHNLGERGLDLYESVATGKTLTRPEVVNLVEACRLADRLEKFDGLIRGDSAEWFEFEQSLDGRVVTVQVADVVRQARMHAATLKALLAGFESSKAAEDAAEPPGEVPANVASIKDGLKAPGSRRTTARSKRSTV